MLRHLLFLSAAAFYVAAHFIVTKEEKHGEETR